MAINEEKPEQEIKDFFSESSLIESMAQAKNIIEAEVEKLDLNQDSEKYHLSKFTLICLSYFLMNPSEADRNCLYSIESVGSALVSAIGNISNAEDVISVKIERLAAYLYQFVTELEISLRYGVPRSLDGWTKEIPEFYFKDSHSQRIYRHARHGAVIGIVRKYLHRVELVTLAELPGLIKKGEVFQDGLNRTIEEKIKDVTRLKNNLDDYEKSFNFLGLNRAFRSMRSMKLKEARKTFSFLLFLGLLMITPLAFKFSKDLWQNTGTVKAEALLIEGAGSLNANTGGISTNPPSTSADTPSLSGKILADEDKAYRYFDRILGLVAFFGYELLILYFFKVVLHNFRSLKAQLLQIDLRVALTQFILKYAEYAGSSKSTTAGTFERFEQIIFSGIVGGDNEIPSTFDGLDQVVKVLEKVRPS